MTPEKKSKDLKNNIFWLFIIWLIMLIIVTWIFGIIATIIFFFGGLVTGMIGLFITYDLWLMGGLDK